MLYDETTPGLLTSGAVDIQAFAHDCHSLAPDAFSARHGAGFLLHQGSLESQGRLARAQPTLIADLRRDGHGRTLPFVTFLVRRTGRSPFPNFVSVGRAKNNDIVLGDGCISKFHAYFRRDDNGSFLLFDSRSKNGTFVDDEPVSVLGRGTPCHVASGALVRFGAIELTFLDAEAFCALVRSLNRRD